MHAEIICMFDLLPAIIPYIYITYPMHSSSTASDAILPPVVYSIKLLTDNSIAAPQLLPTVY